MKTTVAIFLALLLAGCATSSPPPVQLMTPVVSGQPASMNFVLVTTTNTLPDLQAETGQLQDAILSGLRETELFNEVETTNSNQTPTAGIRIAAFIKQITKVSDNSRQWFGGFAGKAQVVVRVTITNLMTGKNIEVFEVAGQTGASAWAGTTSEAIQQAAAKIVDEIKRLNSEAAQRETSMVGHHGGQTTTLRIMPLRPTAT
jgi:hypothetical protein